MALCSTLGANTIASGRTYAPKENRERKPRKCTVMSDRRAKPSPRNGNRLPVGAHRANTGGKKGRSGRIPNATRLQCQDAVLSTGLPKMVRYLKAKGKGPDDPGWRWCMERLMDRGFGKVPRAVEEDGGETIRIKLERAKALRDRMLRRLARIDSRS